MKRLLVPLFILFSALGTLAEPNKDFPKVEDASYTEPNGDRVIQLSADVPATSDEVWRTLTTADGWKSFAVAFATVDLQVGGIVETSYNANARPGDPDNIKNQIVAYIPGRMLAIRCVQTPRNFEHKEEFLSTATVLEVKPLEGKHSRVSLTAVGYRPGAAFDTLFQHFRWGDAYTLDKLRLRFDAGKSTAPVETRESKDFNAK